MKTQPIRKFGKIQIEKNNKLVEQEAWLNIESDEIYLETKHNVYSYDFWETITGTFNSFDKITCVNCYSSSGSSGSGGSWRKIKTKSVFSGIHFNSIKDAKFKSIFLSSPTLTLWFSPVDNMEIIDNHNFRIQKTLS